MPQLMSPMATAAFRLARIAPPSEWVEFMSNPPINYVDRVSVDQALEWMASQSRDPNPIRVVHYPPSSDDDLYKHQLNAVRVTTTPSLRSGVWIMPCGTGKTRAAARVIARTHSRTIVTVPNLETAGQWSDECRCAGVTRTFVVNDKTVDDVMRKRDFFKNPPGVVIMTYAAMSHALRRRGGWEAAFALHLLDYDLHIIDEAHVLPADTYDEAAHRLIRARHRLAMTASLSRSDGRDDRLVECIGDILYTMDIDEAQIAGVLTVVERRVIQIDTNIVDDSRTARVCHPAKMRVLRRLLDDPDHRKILVYCDTLAALPRVSGVVASVKRLEFAGVFSGSTTSLARTDFLKRMRRPDVACVGVLTRAGSSSLDVRDVDTVIDVDVCDASVQKLIQRAGRAQRVHASKPVARVISIVIGDRETDFARRREAYDVPWMICHETETAVKAPFEVVVQTPLARARKTSRGSGVRKLLRARQAMIRRPVS